MYKDILIIDIVISDLKSTQENAKNRYESNTN